MWTWRRVEKIGWMEHKTNKYILEMIGEERAHIRTIIEKQRKWVEHQLRREGLLGIVIEEKMEESEHRKTEKDDWMMANGYEKLKEEA